jgi:hypothetical protein
MSAMRAGACTALGGCARVADPLVVRTARFRSAAPIAFHSGGSSVPPTQRSRDSLPPAAAEPPHPSPQLPRTYSTPPQTEVCLRRFCSCP